MMQGPITIQGCRCERCGWVWVPRQTEPTVCPHCKSPYWNKPKRAKRGKKGVA